MRRTGRGGASRFLLAGLVLLLLGLSGLRAVIFRFYPYHHREEIAKRAEQYHFDPLLLAAVVRTESKWDPSAVSARGARGLMQLMPETGRWAADQLNVTGFKDEQLYDPAVNIRLGTWYLSSLRQEFGGDLVLALAAYNGGRRNVKQWLDSSQWTGEHKNIDQIPFKETRDFIARVMTDYNRYSWLYSGRGRWLTRDWPFWPEPR